VLRLRRVRARGCLNSGTPGFRPGLPAAHILENGLSIAAEGLRTSLARVAAR